LCSVSRQHDAERSLVKIMCLGYAGKKEENTVGSDAVHARLAAPNQSLLVVAYRDNSAAVRNSAPADNAPRHFINRGRPIQTFPGSIQRVRLQGGVDVRIEPTPVQTPCIP
jgi:hypothetical protein